ncbi:MAG TPA: nickel transporter permease [Actinomycetota bacterium]|nr:nickel transporter permease [Actinomycetota bacterium]
MIEVTAVEPVSARRPLDSVKGFLRASRLNVVAVVIVGFVVGVALFGTLLAPYPPNHIDLLQRLRPPSVHHLFGTDDYGRDLFSRVLAGAWISLYVAAVILLVSVGIGTILGIISGLVGGLTDEIIMRVTDLFLAFPALILAAAIAATLGPSLSHTMLALSTVFWPWYARLVRGQVLSLREREFILAARVAGASTGRIVFKHLLRNVFPLVIVQASLDVGYAILFTSSLSFLGLGAQPPTPEWGAMLTDARSFLEDFWWYPTFPGLALAVTVVGFNLLGDGLRDWLDPRLRGSLRAGRW